MMIINLLRDSYLQLSHYKYRSLFLMLISFLGSYCLLQALAFSNGIHQRFALIQKRLDLPFISFSMGTTEKIQVAKLSPNTNILVMPEDLLQIKQAFPQIQSITSGIVKNPAMVSYHNQTLAIPVQGKTAIAGKLEYDIVAQGGRFISAIDMRNNSRVVVLTPYVKKYLFGSNEAIGKIIQIDQVPFMVIGVLDPYQNNFSGNATDVIIPYSTAQDLWPNYHIWFEVQLYHKKDINAFIKDFRNYLANRFNFSTQDKAVINIWQRERSRFYFQQFVSGLEIIFVGIGLMMFLVTALAYINYLVYVIKARKHEISIKMVLGVNVKTLRYQFLIESFLYYLLGFCLAIVAITLAHYVLIRFELPNWLGTPKLNFSILALSFIAMIILSQLFVLLALNYLKKVKLKNILEQI